MEDNKIVKITCEGTININLSELNPLQAKLKSLSTINANKLKRSILKNGFSFPVFVWKNQSTEKWMLIDGHQRYTVLQLLLQDGYDIPLIPCIQIQAGSIEQAREKILLASSQFGKIDEKNLLDFCKLLEVPLQELKDEVELSIDLDKFVLTDEETEDDYSEPNEKTYHIEYTLVFDTEEQQNQWYAWLRELKKKYPDDETIAQRIIKEIAGK